MTADQLARSAGIQSDTQAAIDMQAAKRKRFTRLHHKRSAYMKPGRAVEMTGYGKRGKPNPGFPRFPQPLEIAARFPHSHSPDDESLYQKTTQEAA